MKNTLYIILATLGICLFASCSSPKEKVSPIGKQIEGEWHLTSWTGETPADFDAYLAFNADRTFVIYQLLEESRYQRLTGSYTLSGTVLSGVYSDGVPWGSNYEVVFDEASNKITMTSDTAIQEVNVYDRKEIPAKVKDNATIVMSVRSGQKRLL